MKMNYEGTIKYWDKVFDREVTDPKINEPVRFNELEEGLQWVCENAESVLDFGCGRGIALFRCLGLGVDKVKGIDISPRAVSQAQQTAEQFDLKDRAEFQSGDHNLLKEIDDNSCDAIVLFNIVDNIIPDDSKELLSDVHRIIKNNGRILMKLNDHYPDESLKTCHEFNEVTPGFYHENSGLFLWNLSDENVSDLVAPLFTIQKSVRVELRKDVAYNRLYYLQKRV